MAHRVNRFGPKNDGRFEVALRAAISPRKVQEWRDTSGFENAETWEITRQHGDLDFSTSGRFSRQYHADPIFTPLFLSIIGPGTISFFGTTVSLASVASAIATTAVVTGISYLLAPKPPKPEEVRQPLTQALPPKFWVGGECRLAGAYVLWESKDDKLFSVQAIAGHPITSFKTLYLNDDVVTLTGNLVNAIGDRYSGGNVSIFTRLGVVPETPMTVITGFLSGEGIWTANHRGDGQASAGMICVAASAKKMPKVFPNGRPVLAPVIEGAPFWDFRDPAQDPDDESTWVYSKNSALFLAWHLCFNPYGERKDFRKAILPVLDMWQEEADVCDEDVTKAAGGTEKRYECNGFDTADHDPKGGTNAILATCDGWLCTRGDGAMLFVAGKYREKYVVTLTDADIIGHHVEDDVLFDEEVNRFTPKFTYPATDYTTTDTDSFDDVPAQIIAGRVLPQEGNFLFVQQWRQARRLGKREFARMREKKRGSLDVRLTGINAIYAPWILLDTPNRLPELNGKVISNRRSVLNLMAGGFQTSWVLMPADIDAWTPASDEGAAPPVPAKPASSGLPIPTIDTVTAEATNNSVYLHVAVVDPARTDLTLVLRYRLADIGSGAGPWSPEQDFPDAVPAAGLIEVDTNPVPNDKLLDVQAAFKGPAGTVGTWSASTQVTSTADPVAPGALSAVSTSGNLLGGVTLNFTTPASGNIANVKIYRTPTGVPLNRATHLVETLPVLMSTAYHPPQGDVTRTNLITNSDLAGGTTGYTVGAGWTVGAGVATRTVVAASAFYQTPTITSGKNYRSKFTLVSRTAGSLAWRLNAIIGTGRTVPGTYYQTFTANASGALVNGVYADAAFAGSCDDLVVFEETVTCLAQGTYDIYAEATNASGVAGTLSGPHTVTIA